MFIVWWKGWGWLGGALPLLGAILFTYFGLKLASASYDRYLWTYFSTGIALGGALVVVLARWLETRTMPAGLDPATGLPMTIARTDSLYWIPMRYWGYTAVVVGGASAILTLVTAQ